MNLLHILETVLCSPAWAGFWPPYLLLNMSCMQAEDEYMISDFDLFVTKYISVPKDMGQLNCAAFIAGIVKGALDGAGFPAR